MVSLGCDKNFVDSQEMTGMLQSRGYIPTNDEEEAEAAVVNTCCFIDDAKKESIDAILEMGKLRENGKLKALIVAGCMAQRYREEILKEIPEVDAVLGTAATGKIADVLDAVTGELPEAKKVWMEELTAVPESRERKRVATGTTAYLRIAEGCSKRCSYCVIPDLRGPYRSIPMDRLLEEAQDLVRGGARELILVAQETTLYGMDLYREKKLPELLRKLSWIRDLKWIRLLYCYPEEITKELVAEIKTNPKVLHYIDMPIQHASDDILHKMRRRTNRRELEETVSYLRSEIPDICIRTTLITGFPGETQEDHDVLCSFVKRMRFDRLGVFTYSKEEGTPAALMRPQVPASVKKKRQKELMLLQQEIAFEQARDMEGRILPVMIEGRLTEDAEAMRGREASGYDYVYVARTYKDAPDVDGMLFVETDLELMSGDFVRVRITGASGYDLTGVAEEE